MSFLRSGSSREIKVVCIDCNIKLSSKVYTNTLRGATIIQESLCGNCKDKRRKSSSQEPVGADYVDLFEYFK